MKLVILSALFVFISCGQQEQQQNQNSQVSANQITGILSIPKPGLMGGGSMVKYQGQSYQVSINSSNQTSMNYINQIWNNGTTVQPVSQSNSYIDYNASFSGQLINEQCTFNPMAQCQNFRIDSIRIY